MSEIAPKARILLLRNAYRERFGLTSEEMDNEPLEEFLYNQAIWAAQDRKQRKEQNRSEQNSSMKYNSE